MKRLTNQLKQAQVFLLWVQNLVFQFKRNRYIIGKNAVFEILAIAKQGWTIQELQTICNEKFYLSQNRRNFKGVTKVLTSNCPLHQCDKCGQLENSEHSIYNYHGLSSSLAIVARCRFRPIIALYWIHMHKRIFLN